MRCGFARRRRGSDVRASLGGRVDREAHSPQAHDRGAGEVIAWLGSLGGQRWLRGQGAGSAVVAHFESANAHRHRAGSCRVSRPKRRSRSELVTTLTEENPIAAHATMGFSPPRLVPATEESRRRVCMR